MKRIMAVFLVLAVGSVASASILDEAVVRVTFEGDSWDDQNYTGAGDRSLATKQGTGTEEYLDISSLNLSNSNGRAVKMLDDDYLMDYGLGAGNELQIDGTSALTYHVRTRFINRSGDHFIMGRFGDGSGTGGPDSRVSYLSAWDYTSSQGGGVERVSVTGSVSYNGSNSYAANTGGTSSPLGPEGTGTFYDIFLRYIPNQQTKLTVWDAENGTFVGEWLSSSANPSVIDATTAFEFGGRSLTSVAHLDATVDQFNVWDSAISDTDVEWIVTGIPEPATLGLLAMGGLLLVRRRLAI